MTTKLIPFEVNKFHHLVPIVHLARKAIIAERTLRDLEDVRRIYPDVDKTLAVTGVLSLEDESLLDDAAHALWFVAQVLTRAHENELEGGTNGT